jgi:hypothetical protein
MSLRWYEKQLRVQHTVLREVDIIDYDAEGVVDYLKEIDANCLVVNAGGIIDFFRHDLFASNPNRFMAEGQDILADLTKKCHAAGIKVIARVDFRGVDKRIFELQPDMFALNEKGEPVRAEYMGHVLPETLYVPCYLSFYRNEHAFEFGDVLFTKYNFDGIWENSPFQYGVCYCNRCASKYQADMGKDLPRGGDFLSNDYDEYRDWKGKNLLAHLQNYRAKIKEFGEDKIYCAEIFGLFYEFYKKSSSDLYLVKDAMDFMVTPLFVANHEPLNAPSTMMKFLRALDPTKTPAMLYGHLGTNNQLRYVSTPPAEARIWMWQAVSAGGSLWDCTFNGQHPAKTFDRRGAYLAKDIFGYMKANEEALHNQRPMTTVKILYSKRTSEKFADEDRARDHYITNLIGLEQVLLDKHIQYDFVLDQNLSDEALKGTSLLLVPNAAILSDRELEVLRRFVADGGRMLATHKTSLFDADGNQRRDFALGDVFGCSYSGIEKDVSRWGYQRIKAAHPLTRGFEDTELIGNWGNMLLVSPRKDAKAVDPLTYVPPIFPQPPERSWLRSLETDFPAALINDYGKGRCVYLPSEIDRNVWVHGHPDFATLLGNSIDFLLDGEEQIVTDAPASVQIALTRITTEPGSYLLHLINLTAAPRRPVTDLVPVSNISVQITLPGSDVKGIDILRDDGASIDLRGKTALKDGAIRVEIGVDTLKEYAGIRIRTR